LVSLIGDLVELQLSSLHLCACRCRLCSQIGAEQPKVRHLGAPLGEARSSPGERGPQGSQRAPDIDLVADERRLGGAQIRQILREGSGASQKTPWSQKRYATSFDFVSFSFSSFSLLQQGPGKGDTPKRILLREGNRLRASLLIRGSKAGPSEGFNSRLRARGIHTHYRSEVRRPAPRKGSTAASGHSGSAPTTGQRFEGRPLGRVQRPPRATRAPRPLLIRGS
jgi:hypothetical protein